MTLQRFYDQLLSQSLPGSSSFSVPSVPLLISRVDFETVECSLLLRSQLVRSSKRGARELEKVPKTNVEGEYRNSLETEEYPLEPEKTFRTPSESHKTQYVTFTALVFSKVAPSPC